MQLRLSSCCVLAVLATALALTGCADVDWSSPQAWFAKPVDFAGKKGGYTFSELQETKKEQRPITANELVNSNGSCPPPAVAPAPPPAPGQAAAAPAPIQAAAPMAPDANTLLGGGIALGMSECDVVFRAGQPSSVQIGGLPNGDRTAVLTFDSGPRAGIYRFQRGALREMDSLPVAAAPPKAVKRKPAKTAKGNKAAKVKKENES
ncbi:MAG TPA: hypothetical protein VL048_14740 [Xanthobacteraceae bacterium]|nr:hypothetical protein [Xanthobacteraceae bacterium]